MEGGSKKVKAVSAQARNYCFTQFLAEDVWKKYDEHTKRLVDVTPEKEKDDAPGEYLEDNEHEGAEGQALKELLYPYGFGIFR